jgi:NAD(P)H-dependent FMN reductase
VSEIAIIVGSTRPGRNGDAVAKWVYEVAKKRSDAEFELVDNKDFNLPLLDEPVSLIMGQQGGAVLRALQASSQFKVRALSPEESARPLPAIAAMNGRKAADSKL